MDYDVFDCVEGNFLLLLFLLISLKIMIAFVLFLFPTFNLEKVDCKKYSP